MSKSQQKRLSVQKGKPLVKFFRTVVAPVEGRAAVIFTVDHPLLSNSGVRPSVTSTVLKVNEDGSFETLNTIYVPATGKGDSDG
jgi:hypothetical protein